MARATEHIWETITTNDGVVFQITTKGEDRSTYYLYRLDGDKKVRLGKSKAPTQLEEKYIWRE